MFNFVIEESVAAAFSGYISCIVDRQILVVLLELYECLCSIVSDYDTTLSVNTGSFVIVNNVTEGEYVACLEVVTVKENTLPVLK